MLDNLKQKFSDQAAQVFENAERDGVPMRVIAFIHGDVTSGEIISLFQTVADWEGAEDLIPYEPDEPTQDEGLIVTLPTARVRDLAGDRRISGMAIALPHA